MTQHDQIHANLKMIANRRAGPSAPCLVCGQKQGPDDFRLDAHEGPMASVFRLVPLTIPAKVWVAANVGKDSGYQPDWPTLYVEHRYIDPLLDGIDAAGLTVDVIERVVAGAKTEGGD